MQNNLNEIEELINLISKFPGLGKKSAKRIVIKLINKKDDLILVVLQKMIAFEYPLYKI